MPNTAYLQKCETCGKLFIQLFDQYSKKQSHCRICYKKWEEEKNRKREEDEKQRRQKQWEHDQRVFEKKIREYRLVSHKDILPTEHTLYIIGNGFDLMHRVPSNYYNFRDSLKENSSLRYALESALTPIDIWADFEESLAHLNMDLMGGRHIVNMWLDNFDNYTDEDAGGAEFYMAVEAAANPIITIANELQPALRKWVDTLSIGTKDRPLQDLFHSSGKVLCFNYTEFAKTLYGMKDICYIHGCRKKKKQKLIIGHRSGISMELHEKARDPKTYRQAMIDLAQDNVLQLICDYDKELIKDSLKTIQNHQDFFEGLESIDTVIVIGHSLSKVDWDYFVAINQKASKASWYFGCYGLNDLKNMKALINMLQIQNVSLFRTDKIWTTPNQITVAERPKSPQTRTYSQGDTTVTVQSCCLRILQNNKLSYEVVLPYEVKRVLFFDDFLLVILDDLEKSILLFKRKDEQWVFLDQLKNFEHQSLLNRRLRHVYVFNNVISFVYNNHVRMYNLESGEMIVNQHVRAAKDAEYAGTDVIKAFFK